MFPRVWVSWMSIFSWRGHRSRSWTSETSRNCHISVRPCLQSAPEPSASWAAVTWTDGRISCWRLARLFLFYFLYLHFIYYNCFMSRRMWIFGSHWHGTQGNKLKKWAGNTTTPRCTKLALWCRSLRRRLAVDCWISLSIIMCAWKMTVKWQWW